MGKKKGKGKSGQDDQKKTTEPTPQSSTVSDTSQQEGKTQQQKDEKPIVKQDSGEKKVGRKPVETPQIPIAKQDSGEKNVSGKPVEPPQISTSDPRPKGGRQQDQRSGGDQQPYQSDDRPSKGPQKQKGQQHRKENQQPQGGAPQKGDRSGSATTQRSQQQNRQRSGEDSSVSPVAVGTEQKNLPKQSTGRQTSKKQEESKNVQATASAPVIGGDQKANVEKLSQQLVSLNFDEVCEKSVKGGTKGRLCRIETNYLKLRLNKLKTTAYHYDVEFTPEKGPKRFYVIAMENFRRKYFPNKHPAFDGRKNLYSAVSLIDSKQKQPYMEGEVDVEDENGRITTFKIKIQLAACIDLRTLANYMAGKNMEKPQRAIQCLDIVFRHAPSIIFTRVGRSFFAPPTTPQVIKLSGGMELWHGIFQSAILGSEPFLNVDVANKAFPIEQDLISLMLELMDTSGGYSRGPPQDNRQFLNNELRMDHYEKLRSFIKGLKIKYQIPNKATTTRIAKVLNVVGSARKERFKLNDSKEMTVEDYFLKEKNCRLQYPNLPCLHVGNPGKKIYYPLELCSVVAGQVINKKLNEEQTTKMIRQTATSTYVRKQKIMSTVQKLNFNDNLCMKEFGLEVDQKFVEVNSRVLEPPTLRYQNNVITPQDGTWRPSKFFNSSKMVQWTILNLDYRVRKEDLKQFENLVQDTGKSMGMVIQNPQASVSLDIDRGRSDDIDKYFSDLQKRQIDLVFIVLPSQKTSDVYCQIKQKAELRHGVLTQCIKSKTMNRMNRSTVSNILLKVNAKLNGTNHIFQSPPRILKEEACMIVGADVTHPSPEQQAVPSVAAVAASCDLNGAVYNFHWSLQHPTVEIIEELGSIIKKQLLLFREKTKRVPSSILFFRDGVSEGQFSEVRHKEISAIEKACSELSKTYRPKITFLVVQKRHHTRFFPIRPEDGDKNGNVQPGTCVDSVITFPNKMDFYLCSHASLQGVSRPTRYCVLLNEHNFVEDDIEELTYYLCHLFTRCTRSVSYPAPTYYAHLAAFRARNYLNGHQVDMENLKATEERYLIQNNFHKNSPMFFV